MKKMSNLIERKIVLDGLVKWREEDGLRKLRSPVERWVRRVGINVLIKSVERIPGYVKPNTNHERIVQMSAEELAGLLASVRRCGVGTYCDGCLLRDTEKCTTDGIMEWLEREVSDDAEAD